MPSWIEKRGDILFSIATFVGTFAALVNILNQRSDASDRRFDSTAKSTDRLANKVSGLRGISFSKDISRIEGRKTAL